MSRLTSRKSMPFVVSVALIFSYSLLMAVVPPSVIGIDETTEFIATTPEQDSQADRVTHTKASRTNNDADRTLQ